MVPKVKPKKMVGFRLVYLQTTTKTIPTKQKQRDRAIPRLWLEEVGGSRPASEAVLHRTCRGREELEEKLRVAPEVGPPVEPPCTFGVDACTPAHKRTHVLCCLHPYVAHLLFRAPKIRGLPVGPPFKSRRRDRLVRKPRSQGIGSSPQSCAKVS